MFFIGMIDDDKCEELRIFINKGSNCTGNGLLFLMIEQHENQAVQLKEVS